MTKHYNRLNKKILWMLLLPAGLFLASCRNHSTPSGQAARIKTETVTAVLHTFYTETKGFGTIQATDALDLEAKFDGIVHFKNLKGRIKKGTVIYTLTGPEIDLKRENMQKALAVAQTQYRYYRQYYEAKKKLAEKSYLSRIEFEKVTSGLQNAQNNLNAARYGLDYFLTMTRYKAPFDGYLDNIQVPQGEDAVAGQLLATFQDDDHVKLVAPFYGSTRLLGHKNLKINIGGKEYHGRIGYIEKAVNPATGGHTLWVFVDDTARTLKTGQYVSYAFLTGKHTAVAVPEKALVKQGSRYFVVQVKGNGFVRIPVVPGEESNGFTEIKKGLAAGQKVLTRGAFEVFFGDLRKTMQVED